MFERLKDALADRLPRTPVLIGVAVAAIGITAALVLSNAGPAGASCAANPAARAAIDAAAGGELAALNATAGGRSFADLGFIDDTGKPLTMGDLGGRMLLVNFWATWCKPCREEMPDLDAVAAKFGGADFAVAPINLDLGDEGVQKAQDFLDEMGLSNLPLYADPTLSSFDRLKYEGVAIGLPATLLLDETGCELAVLQGPAKWASPDGDRVIEALIGLKKAE